MNHKHGKNHRLVHWIEATNLHTLKIKSKGRVGGCKSATYVETEDGELFLIKEE